MRLHLCLALMLLGMPMYFGKDYETWSKVVLEDPVSALCVRRLARVWGHLRQKHNAGTISYFRDSGRSIWAKCEGEAVAPTGESTGGLVLQSYRLATSSLVFQECFDTTAQIAYAIIAYDVQGRHVRLIDRDSLECSAIVEELWKKLNMVTKEGQLHFVDRFVYMRNRQGCDNSTFIEAQSSWKSELHPDLVHPISAACNVVLALVHDAFKRRMSYVGLNFIDILASFEAPDKKKE